MLVSILSCQAFLPFSPSSLTPPPPSPLLPEKPDTQAKMRATVRFSGLVASFSSIGSWVFRFRVLRASFSNITYFFFEFKVSFVFEFSVLLIKRLHLFLATTYRVYSDDCALRRFVAVSGVVVSLRCFKSLLYLCQSSIARRHLTRTFKKKYFKCCLLCSQLVLSPLKYIFV